ncbi:MAG: OmpA family protein [Saprospiraceae bacterium]
MLKTLPCLFVLLTGFLPAQNLVVNPGFEQLQPGAVVVACQFMQYSVNFPAAMQDWNSFYGLTPDVLHGADNCPTLPQTHGGDYCIGLIQYMPANDVGQKTDYHEMVQGRLRRPLKPGQRYRLELWVREDSALMQQHLLQVYGPKTPYAAVRCGNLGFCFLIQGLKGGSGIDWLDKKNNLRPQVNFPQVIATQGQWVKLSTTFTAEQPFQYFVLGNFFEDAVTPTDLPEKRLRAIENKNAGTQNPADRIKRVAYVCIDDISIVAETDGAPEKPADLATQLLTDRKYTFSAGLLFDTGQADLRSEAGPELDKLVEFLVKHPATRLGIAGHTDDQGSEPDNQQLSERRARAVYDFLLNKNIPANRIQWKGFGETRPVADNTTESGRQQNRRVECVVL